MSDRRRHVCKPEIKEIIESYAEDTTSIRDLEPSPWTMKKSLSSAQRKETPKREFLEHLTPKLIRIEMEKRRLIDEAVNPKHWGRDSLDRKKGPKLRLTEADELAFNIPVYAAHSSKAFTNMLSLLYPNPFQLKPKPKKKPEMMRMWFEYDEEVTPRAFKKKERESREVSQETKEQAPRKRKHKKRDVYTPEQKLTPAEPVHRTVVDEADDLEKYKQVLRQKDSKILNPVLAETRKESKPVLAEENVCGEPATAATVSTTCFQIAHFPVLFSIINLENEITPFRETHIPIFDHLEVLTRSLNIKTVDPVEDAGDESEEDNALSMYMGSLVPECNKVENARCLANSEKKTPIQLHIDEILKNVDELKEKYNIVSTPRKRVKTIVEEPLCREVSIEDHLKIIQNLKMQTMEEELLIMTEMENKFDQMIDLPIGKDECNTTTDEDNDEETEDKVKIILEDVIEQTLSFSDQSSNRSESADVPAEEEYVFESENMDSVEYLVEGHNELGSYFEVNPQEVQEEESFDSGVSSVLSPEPKDRKPRRKVTGGNIMNVKEALDLEEKLLTKEVACSYTETMVQVVYFPQPNPSNHISFVSFKEVASSTSVLLGASTRATTSAQACTSDPRMVCSLKALLDTKQEVCVERDVVNIFSYEEVCWMHSFEFCKQTVRKRNQPGVQFGVGFTEYQRKAMQKQTKYDVAVAYDVVAEDKRCKALSNLTRIESLMKKSTRVQAKLQDITTRVTKMEQIALPLQVENKKHVNFDSPEPLIFQYSDHQYQIAPEIIGNTNFSLEELEAKRNYSEGCIVMESSLSSSGQQGSTPAKSNRFRRLFSRMFKDLGKGRRNQRARSAKQAKRIATTVAEGVEASNDQGKVLRTVFRGQDSVTELVLNVEDLVNIEKGLIPNINIDKKKIARDHTRISLTVTQTDSLKEETSETTSSLSTSTSDQLPQFRAREPQPWCSDFSSDDSSRKSDDEDCEEFKSAKSSTHDSSAEEEAVKPRKVKYKNRLSLNRFRQNWRLDNEKEREPLKKALKEMEAKVANIKSKSYFNSPDYYERALRLTSRMTSAVCRSCGSTNFLTSSSMPTSEKTLRSVERRTSSRVLPILKNEDPLRPTSRFHQSLITEFVFGTQ